MTANSVDYYVSKLISQHQGKPKLSAMLSLLLTPIVETQQLLSDMRTLFDLDTAVGVQLDAVGLRANLSRYVDVPLANLWFSFGDAQRGFGLGVWYDGVGFGIGTNRLGDDLYRTCIRARIACSYWDGTVPGAQAIFDYVFSASPGTLMFYDDQQGMTSIIGIAGKVPNLVLLYVVAKHLPLEIAGVNTKYLVTTNNGGPLFGFGTDSPYIGGFGVGAWGASPDYYVNNLVP